MTSPAIAMSIRRTMLKGSGKVSTALGLVLSLVPVEGFLLLLRQSTFKRERSKFI